MSRDRYWDYVMDDVGAWDRFFTDIRAYGVPLKCVPTGGANTTTGEAHLLLYTNRTKARRIKADLDAASGIDGTLRPSQ